jgi:hypothetical protein
MACQFGIEATVVAAAACAIIAYPSLWLAFQPHNRMLARREALAGKKMRRCRTIGPLDETISFVTDGSCRWRSRMPPATRAGNIGLKLTRTDGTKGIGIRTGFAISNQISFDCTCL